MTLAVVLADTHISEGSTRRLPDAACRQLRRADVILHAGDVLGAELLELLGRLAPVHAVLGNNDRSLIGALPEVLDIDVDGVRIGMIHDSGPTAGRAARMHRRFPASDVVVFGHSHQPIDAEGVGGQRLFNPGSPTQRRRAPGHTIGVLACEAGRLVHHAIVGV